MQINSAQMESQVRLCMLRKENKGCIEQVMARKRGPVNYTTLKGLSLYQLAIKLLEKYVPACGQKFNSHESISTIPQHFHELCPFVPIDW